MAKSIVVVSSPINEVGVELLRKDCEVRQVFYGVAPYAELEEAMRDADGVITRSLNVTGELMRKCPRLKVVAKHGAGVDTIDVAAATELGIVVANSGDANALGVAEHAVALMLAVLRRVPEVHAITARGGGFAERERTVFGDLWEAEVGLVGFGNIGRAVAQMCAGGFKSSVSAFDPTVPADQMAARGVRKVDDLEELLRRSDIVSLHVPLTPQTRHLIGADQLRQMKPDAILVNTSRGGIVDEAALHAALSAGSIAGAGLDVFETEPPPPDNPLFSLRNIVLSPHIGGATLAARRRSATRSAQAALAVLSGRWPDYPINPAVVGRTRAAIAA